MAWYAYPGRSLTARLGERLTSAAESSPTSRNPAPVRRDVVTVIPIPCDSLESSFVPLGKTDQMAYHPDLAPCDYGGPMWRADNELAVGWLSIHHPFTTGDFPAELLDRLAVLVTKPVHLRRGKHSCDICPPPVETQLASRPTSLRRGRVERRLEQMPNGEVRDEWIQWERTDHVVFVSGQEIDVGNGEIRIADEDGLVFAAPTIILHYIVEHCYLPPDAFIEALRFGRVPENPLGAFGA